MRWSNKYEMGLFSFLKFHTNLVTAARFLFNLQYSEKGNFHTHKNTILI